MWEKYSHIISHIAVGSGVINNIADWALSCGYKSVLVVCDPVTRSVAGSRVIDLLRLNGLVVNECCFTMDEPVPDEHAIGFVTAAYSSEIDIILGVGSGTINDICTFVGAKVGCPSAIVGTAPSMDGYASLGSAMLLDGIKVTPPTQCPVAIFCDIDIFAEAPMLLTAAGLGDMLGKITAHADWHLANILVNEPMPEDILNIVKNALAKILEGAPHLISRDPAVIQSVTEGLILSGIAMSLYGDSRPASGTEHHLAHFWEMRMIAEGTRPALHGIKVGLATVVGLVVWKFLLAGASNIQVSNSSLENDKCRRAVPFLGNEPARGYNIKSLPDGHPARGSFQKKELPDGTTIDCKATNYENDIRRLYGRNAEAILQTANPILPIEHIKGNLEKILDIANALPEPEEIAAMLAAVGAPIRPAEIGLDEETLRESIIYAKDRKKTYTVMQLLGNLGMLEQTASHVSQYFKKNTLEGVKCFVLDMDGTIYLGNKLFPFTIDSLYRLSMAGKDYVFYTNNSSQNAAHYINKLKRMSIYIQPEKLMMSTQVLLDYLSNQSCQRDNIHGMDGSLDNLNNVFVAGTKALQDDFVAAGYTLTEDDPDFVVLGFDTDMDYQRLTKLCDFVRAGIPYYGVHMDYNCPVEGGFIPDCGSLAAAVTAATGITPEFFGKPSRYTLDYIIQKTGYKEDEICFVGDRLYTDIAITLGTKARSVLVLSGETKREDLLGSAFVPDIIVNDLTELIEYI
ncbi:MAG: iron-containing alcohol dehydrogenase [Oscillospiraceae bacterium]|jgi:glycerol-1-phosphate dehydrogenase [NAD(P)+]|nr:iron-containing alcohol dehydrogenase [Oscillospiraceae bacterium]